MPNTVWRAVSNPAFREKWLPQKMLAEAEPIFITPDKAVSYRMRDDKPSFLESIVRFEISPDTHGGTILKIIHLLADTRLAQQIPQAANNNAPMMMCAA